MDESIARMDINERGFLSPDIELFRLLQRAQYQLAFKDVEAESDAAYKLTMAAGADVTKPHMVFALAYLQRTVRSCQAAITLCERGLIVDAQTLARSALEALFYGVALINEPSVLARMARQGDLSEATLARRLIEMRSGCDNAEHDTETLDKIVQRADSEGPGFSCFDAARVAGLLPLYESMYRFLSSLASHATLRSLDSSIVTGGDGIGLINSPVDSHLEVTLKLVQSCLGLVSIKVKEGFIFDE